MKNKKFLIGFMAVSMAAASLSVLAIVNAKKAEYLNSVKQANATDEFIVDLTDLQSTGDEGVYQAVALDGSANEVNTKFVGVTPTENGFSVAANSTAYITNIDSIRGIQSFKACYSGTAQIISYGSSNVLTIENIFSGKYQDLAYVDGGGSGDGYQYILGNSVKENSFANCHYILAFIINQGNTTLNFTKVTFSAVCEAEPETQEIGVYDDFTDTEKERFVTEEVPADFPFPGSGSYTLQYGAGPMQVAMNCLLNMENYIDLINAVGASGYKLNPPAIGPIVDSENHYTGIGVQRKRGDIVDTLLLTIADPINGYVYMQVGYTNAYPEMAGASEWPTEDINSRFPGLANYYVPLQLSDATYSIMMAEEYRGTRNLYMYITVEDIDVAMEEINTYLAGLDNSVYTVDGYTIFHVDGLHKMKLDIQTSAKTIAVTLTELVVYNSFPFDQLKNNFFSVFPKESSMDEIAGKYTIDFDDVTAKEFDDSDLELLISNLEAKGFYHMGNSTNGVIKARISGDMEYYGTLAYYKISNSSYLFRSNYYNVDNDNDSLLGAYERTSDYEAYMLFEDVLDYDGQFKIVQDDNIFVISLIDGTYADYEAMYAAIDNSKVAYKEMFSSRHSFSFAVETEYSNPGDESYENFDLYFTETESGLDIEIIAENYRTGSATFAHSDIGTYANQTNALSMIETGAYGSPLAVPNGNNYLIGTTNSIEYNATAEETRNIANSYANTLLNYGYHYEPTSRVFVSPNNDHPNVRIIEDHCPGRLMIEFTKMSVSNSLVNYNDLSSDDKAFLAHFPSISVEGGKYALVSNSNTSYLYFDTEHVIPMAYLIEASENGFVTEYQSDEVLSPYATLMKIDNNYNYYEIHYSAVNHLVFAFEYDYERLELTYETSRFKPVDSTYFDDKFYDYVILPENGYIALDNSKEQSETNRFFLLGGYDDYAAYLETLGFEKQNGGYRWVKTETIAEVEYYTVVEFSPRNLYTACNFRHEINDNNGKE